MTGFTINDLILIGSILWGLLVIVFFIHFAFNPQFRIKLPFIVRRISSKKFGKIVLKIAGFIIVLYLLGGAEWNQSRVISGLLLFSGVMVLFLIITEPLQSQVRKVKGLLFQQHYQSQT